MPPKGFSKRAAANKKAVAPKKPSAPKRIQFSDMTIPKNAPVLLDDNGFVVGSKEANWALLKKSGNWFTFLEDEDVKDAEQHGMFTTLLPDFGSTFTNGVFRSHSG